MQKLICAGVLLVGAMSFGTLAIAQQPAAKKSTPVTTDIAITYSLEHSQVAQVNGNAFWLNGGSLNGAVTFYKGLGIAANFTGEHASNVSPGVNFGKVAYMAGPRYTYSISRYADKSFKNHATQVFVEFLAGGVHGFDSVFPATSGITTSASAFSMQIGGGADVAIKRGFAMRVLELDFVHTSLPNNAANSQNDFRMGFGISYRR
jgi:hypothetical protein